MAPVGTDSSASTRPSIANGAAVGLCVAAALAAMDCADVLVLVRFASAGDAGLLGVAAVSTLLLAGAAVGGVAVAWTAAATRFVRSRRRRPGRWFEALLVALPLAAFGFGMFANWLRSGWLPLTVLERCLAIGAAFVAIGGTSLLVADLFVVSARHGIPARRRAAVIAAAAAGGVALALADRFLVLLPEELHHLVAFEAALAIALAVRWILHSVRPISIQRRQIAFALGGSLAVLVALDASDVSLPAATKPLFYGKLVLALRSATDFDRDGSSGLFGGRDCRPFDPRIGPSRGDVPDNDLDENCSGGDAQREATLSRSRYPIPDKRGFNVVWISIDALRADHVSAYGYSRRTTPNIDRLAREGIRFERAFVQSTSTWDSVPSMLTGRYPHSLPRNYADPRAKLARRWYTYALGPEAPLLSDRLRSAGYTTAGFSPFRLFPQLGFADHFARYERTVELLSAGERFIAETQEPFLLWQHLSHPHEPYEEHLEFRFGPGAVDRYDSEIAFSDSIVGGLVRALERRGLLERTIVVITADHGEAFGEHGKRFHGRSCYVEQIHVPLVLRVPGMPPRAVRPAVELVALAPTLLELLGIEAGSARFDGESLLRGLADPASLAARGAYCEYFRNGVTLQALRAGDWTLVSDLEADSVELFASDRDPSELVNVERHEPAVRARLLESLGKRASHPSLEH